MDKISIVVPIYNVKPYLSRCVKSIVEQTYSNLEIILVDDGSTDGSSQLCDSYNDPRIIVIHKKNEGLGLSRNAGMKKATGKYLMFVDSDDYIDSRMVEKLHNDLVVNNADTCIGGFKRVYGSKIVKKVNPLSGRVYDYPRIKNEVLVKMMGKDKIIDDHIEMSVWKVLFSNSIIQQNHLLFPSERKYISEDIIFDIEYYSNCKRVYMSDDTGYNYCDNSNSLTTKYNSNRFNLQVVLFNKLKSKMQELGLYTEAKQRLYNTLVANTRYCIKQEQKFNNRKKALKNIKIICNNEILHKVLSDYSNNEPLKSKMINKLIYNKSIGTLWYVMFIKNELNI